jgi:peroxiredoxin Q/BCP
MTTPTLGQAAPAFEAISTAGTIRLSDTFGHKLVLYFYPKDNTPGCTTQTKEFSESHDAFRAADCFIAGVSRDSLKSHEKFSTNLGLPFPLISDPEEVLCNLYNVMRLKNMYGKTVRGIERSTFLIDANGQVVREWRGVKVPGHVKEVLGAVRGLPA